MSEYTKIETARSIICDMCECLYPDGYCPEKCDLEKCDWMEHLKEDAANVAPVVHGRWIRIADDDAWAECSECGDRYSSCDNGGTPEFMLFCNLYKYCPNCGAKMDGDSDAKTD